MKSKIFNFSNAHAFSFVAAGLVHGAIGAWALMPSKPIVINQQAIQISFVAPTSSEKSQKTENKITQNVERENALKQKQNNKGAKAESKEDKNLFAGKKTSGRQDPNATATKAAESEPLFNAAYLNNPAPEYPAIAKRRGIQGKVLVNVLVKADGTPALVEISRSSGSSNLDSAALDAVKQWKFIPARRGGLSVQANVIVPVEFKII
jgi:TonB family protein